MKLFLIALLLNVMLTACSPNLVEVARIASKDQQSAVIIVNRETNATVATPTELYLVGAGDAPRGEPFWRADNVEGLNVIWISKKVIVVSAKWARVFRSEPVADIVKEKGSKSEKIEVQYRIDTAI